MSASGKPQWQHLYEPKVSGFVRVPRDDLSAVRRAIGPNTAAVMLEPIQGETGVIPFSTAFLRGLRDLTHELGVLLALDEIQTGVGRTGRMFCFEHAEICPDVMTLGKGIGSGIPLAALLAREEVCLFEPGDQGGTFNGNALMTAVGCAVVEEISSPAFLALVRENGEYLAARLRMLSQELALGEVRGQGLLLALELNQEMGSRVVEAALARHLLINSPRPATLRFMPALNVTQTEIDQMIRILQQVIQGVKN
jgi:acetylornithine/N-succinyldiaminopimelate aminotransferase